jgi:exportin-7
MAATALSCLVQLSAVRRSFFNNTERMKYLNELCLGVKKVLQTTVGLDDSHCYHEFCRLLARLKYNYQLSEMMKLDYYAEIVQLIAKFTITSLGVWHFSQNSLYYLLSLWQRLVASVPYTKSQEPHLLEIYTPEITKVYIQTRLELVNAVLKNNLEDPFEDLANIYQQLEQISIIGRCEYEKTCKTLVELFDTTAQEYQNLTKLSESTRLGLASKEESKDLKVKQDQMTWLVYIIGGVIGGRISYNIGNSEENDLYDGELVVRVLQLMQFINTRLESQQHSEQNSEQLDLALLNFFEQFRKIFIGDQVQKSSKVYKRMSELLGIHDETLWLKVVTSKIITNLKFWTKSEKIINKTLTLLNDLSVSYSSVRKLMKLETIHFLLANHTSENFPFLGYNNSFIIKDMKCRTTFYMALGRLLNLDFGENEYITFEQFIRPLSNQLDTIGNMMLKSNGVLNFKQTIPTHELNQIKLVLVGLSRDIRGLAFAFNSRAAYMQLFDWLYPSYLELFTKAVELWYDEPFVTTPVLKLMAELVQNRSQRLTFDISSPNGILLFRESSRLVCTYGSRILQIANNTNTNTNLQINQRDGTQLFQRKEESNGSSTNRNRKKSLCAAGGGDSDDQNYSLKIKGISICFNILKCSLSGGYVNFGIFQLYSDPALNNVLEIFVKLLVTGFQHNDLVIYSKLSQNYYALLETLSADHISFVSMLEPNIFMYILQTISDGLNSVLDSAVSTSCSSALDHIVTFLFKTLRTKHQQQQQQQQLSKLVQFYQQQPSIFQQVLNSVINTIVFEDCRNQWSMSRPLLGLILLNEQYFENWRNNLIASSNSCLSIIKSQASLKDASKDATSLVVHPKERIDNCLKNLMSGIERNLSLKNRDKFTQNIATFRRDLNDCLKTSIVASNGGSTGSNTGENNAQLIDFMQQQMTQQQQLQNIPINLLTASSA